MQKITDNVYVETGFQGSNNGFVVTSAGVVMIDTPQMPADAVKWREEIARHGEVRYLLNTEPHGDHISGNHFFGGISIVQEGIRDAILDSSVDQLKERIGQTSPESLPLLEGFSFRLPDITFSARLTIYCGDHTFELIHMPGHSPYQTAVHIPEEKVVFTSDNIFHRVFPFLHQALPDEWLRSLDMLDDLDADILVPGHGEVCDPSYLPEMAATVQAWVDAVKEAIAKGWSLEKAQERVSVPGNYDVESPMAPMVTKMNVARLYEVFGK